MIQDKKLDIIILRGAPASGKSQSAKCLTKFFPKGVKMEVDALRKMVISVDWTNQEEHINILKASTRLVSEFLKLGLSPVIIVDTFSGNKIDKYLDTLYHLNKDVSIRIFGLYAEEHELRRRLDLRAEDEFRDFEICRKLNGDVLKIKHESEYQIDTTGLLPTQTAEIIYNQLDS